jgi:hypothetical protein
VTGISKTFREKVEQRIIEELNEAMTTRDLLPRVSLPHLSVGRLANILGGMRRKGLVQKAGMFKRDKSFYTLWARVET